MEVSTPSSSPPSLPSLPLDVIEAVGLLLPFKDRQALVPKAEGALPTNKPVRPGLQRGSASGEHYAA